MVDEPVTINNWTPRNYTSRYLGPITLQTAVAPVDQHRRRPRAPIEVGRDNVARTAHRLGIDSKINTDPADGAGRLRGQPAGDGPGLRPLLRRRHLGPASTASSASAPPAGKVLYEHKRRPEAAVVISNPAAVAT